jgi:hypothetical protein
MKALGLGVVVAWGALSACGGGEATGDASTSATGTGGAGGALSCPVGSHAREATPAGWANAPSLAKARDHHVTFVVEAGGGPFLYALGGVQNMTTALKDGERTAIAAKGSLGPWQSVSIPEPILGGGVAVVGTTVVITAGIRAGAGGKAALSAKCNVAAVGADGSLQWSTCLDLAETLFHHAMVASGDHLYVVGGLTGAGKDNTAKVEIATISGGKIGAWSDGMALPDKRSHHGLAVGTNALYVTGGLKGDPAGANTGYRDVLRAPIAADGSLGAWATVGELPANLGTHSSFVWLGQLYVLGGVEGDIHNTDAVRRAPIAADGTVGAWETLPPLPKKRAHAHQTPLFRGFVHSVGGAFEHSSIADVYIGNFQ